MGRVPIHYGDRSDTPRPQLAPLRRNDPDRIGPYQLLGRLGAGAMGRVYLGRSAAGRLVAVKTIRDEFAEEPDFRDRFAHEVAAARRVSGVFTAAVVAADAEAEVPWLATAYVAAPSLARLVETCGPLPSPAVRWLAAGCAEALESIHGVGLVHRDLKPSNVLVSVDGPQVIDFGVSRAVERIQLTATREALGTPAYMAPEQARESRRTNAASDVFSLGSTLLYAATGHAPYRGDTTVDVLVRLATEPPDLSGLPPDLSDTVAPCLDRDPQRRPTPAALLAGIAATMRYDDGDGDGARSLPAGALGLMEQYRRRPAPTPAPADAESTFGSRPSLPAIPESGPQPAASLPRARPPAPPEQPGDSGPEPPPESGRHRRGTDRRIIVALIVLAAVVLAGGGIALGTVLGGDGNGTSQQAQNQPPPGPPPDDPPPPRNPADAGSGGPPKLIINQPRGDKDTVPVLQGTGWRPGTQVTVRVLGGPTSPVHPVIDRAGSFNYTVNQAHELFPDGLPSGHLVLVASAPGGPQLQVGFEVNP
jgi:serine/threonine protein kinase